MPTITFSLEDLQQLVGKSITPEELEQLAHYAKGELESYDKKTGEASISLDDTNLPYLWSAEGLARLFRGVLGKQQGIPELVLHKSSEHIIVDSSVKTVRPYIAAFVFKGKPLSEYLLKQLIQLQEKFCDGYGRKRQKASIGLYSHKRITFPVHYTTTTPTGTAFVPLDFEKALTPAEILEQHPKGRDYGWILKAHTRYPLLIDNKNEVLSLPPIINSNFTGRIEVGDTDVLFEVTGTDEESINLATNIFAQALYERNYALYSVKIDYGSRKVVTPRLTRQTVTITKDDVSGLLGLDLSEKETKHLLAKAGYSFDRYEVTVPPYRADIMHKFDIIEDAAIMYGFQNIDELPLASYTLGGTTDMVRFVDKARELMVGLGYQESMSQILSNKETLHQKMGVADTGTIEIEEYMSETYSVVRSWLLPIMMEFLSKNKHVDYPQRIFEQGLVTVRKGTAIRDHERLAAVSAHTAADFTEMKQVLEALLRSIGTGYTIEPEQHSSFIAGRCGRVSVKNKAVAYIGEVHPKVLAAWGLEVPVAAMEINLSDLAGVIGK